MEIKNNDQFSGFGYGYRNKKGEAVLQIRPESILDIPTVYKYITSEAAKPATDMLRSMIGKYSDKEISDFKKLNFKFACVRGIFSKRCANGLITPTPYLPIDIDGRASIEEARKVQQIIIDDPMLNVALSFVSPKGLGAKIFIELPDWASSLDYSMQYEIIAKHIAIAHGIAVDLQCKDVARAAFLCYDSFAYINPKYNLKKVYYETNK